MFQAYLITCLQTGKRYVGITGRSVEQRWKSHLIDARRRNGSVLWAAIRKYGEAVFRIESVACAGTLADILATERILIQQFDTFAPAGYNLTLGGEGRFGFKPSDDSVERSAAKHRGKPCHPNTKRAASLAHKGKPKSAEMRTKLSQARKGTHRTHETKAKIAAYWAARRQRGEFKTLEPYAHCK